MRELMQNLGDLSGLDITLAGWRPGSAAAGQELWEPMVSGAVRARLAAWFGLAERDAGRCRDRTLSPAVAGVRPVSERCPAART